jgi:splicing factor 45
MEQRNATPAQERPAKKQKISEPKKPTKAELMMAKMGYKKGQGLGKNNDGVTTHLEVKARKDQGPRQTRDDLDEDSGSKGFKTQQVFDITGGLRKEGTDHGRFGEPSKVIVAVGCLDGVDMSKDSDRDDGGIRQEIGDMFNEKVRSSYTLTLAVANEMQFGKISRIHVDLSNAARPVYIQFEDALCALNVSPPIYFRLYLN